MVLIPAPEEVTVQNCLRHPFVDSLVSESALQQLASSPLRQSVHAGERNLQQLHARYLFPFLHHLAERLIQLGLQLDLGAISGRQVNLADLFLLITTTNLWIVWVDIACGDLGGGVE